MRLVVFIILLFLAQKLSGQSLADSIIKSLSVLPDTQKASRLIDQAAHIQNKDYANCIVLCDAVIVIANQHHRHDLLGEAFLLKGLTSYFAGEYDATLGFYYRAIAHFDSIGQASGKARVFNELGFFYRKQKNDSAALNSFREAHRLAKLENNEAVMATAINNQGVWAQDHAQHSMAMNLFAQAQQLYTKLKDSIGISYTLDYTAQSLAAEKHYAEAYRQQLMALDIRFRFKDTNAAALSLICLAEFALAENNLAAEENYLLRCIAITERIRYKELTAYCYRLMAALYEKKGDLRKAYDFQIKYTKLNEEIFNESKSKQINEMQARYETEKRLQQIRLLTSENELKENQQRNQRNLFIALIIVLLIGTFTFYIFYQGKKQREHDEALIQEKEERSRAIIEAEEKERLRIARDLHDGVAQTMTGAKMQLEHFIEEAKARNQLSDALQNAFDLVSDAAKEVRSISHSMIPNALLKSGLVAAVRDFVQRMGSEKVKINLVIMGLNERLGEQTETLIFRILQELISNIIKHAAATAITIQLFRQGSEFTLMVEDNGRGFDVEKSTQQEGIGLRNIASRVEYLSGTVNFDSTVGKGSTIIVEIPL